MLLITGITGLTGRFLLDCLRNTGYNGTIRCLIRNYSNTSWIKDKNIEFFLGDVSDINSLKAAVKGVTGVIHLVNIRYTPQVIEACNAVGVDRVIFVSTTGIFSKYRKYSEDYKRLENEIFMSNLQYTIIRPTMIYGNQRDKNIHKLIMIINKYAVIPVVGSGDGLMQPIYARDLASVITEAYLREISVRKIYNVAGKSPIKLIDILKLIATALEKKRLFIKIPFGLALCAGYLGEKIPNGLINVEKILRLKEDKVFDYSDAVNDLGFSPISFEEGINHEIKALREAGLLK